MAFRWSGMFIAKCDEWRVTSDGSTETARISTTSLDTRYSSRFPSLGFGVLSWIPTFHLFGLTRRLLLCCRQIELLGRHGGQPGIGRHQRFGFLHRDPAKLVGY